MLNLSENCRSDNVSIGNSLSVDVRELIFYLLPRLFMLFVKGDVMLQLLPRSMLQVVWRVRLLVCLSAFPLLTEVYRSEKGRQYGPASPKFAIFTIDCVGARNCCCTHNTLFLNPVNPD